MVYCGKASLGCSSCRKRRIKCDRRQPECTQCVRLSKACPGYRDQLSLMFRDETVKVEKKVRASWGLNEPSAAAGSSSFSSSFSSSSSSSSASQTASAKPIKSSTAASSAKKRGSPSIPTPPASVASTSPMSEKSTGKRSVSPSQVPVSAGAIQQAVFSQNIPPERVSPYQTLNMLPVDLGVSFYAQRFILGYPDEVRNPEELNTQKWFQHPSSQATMAAMGLAALGNLNNDKQMQLLSQVMYGEALAGTNNMLRDPVNNLETAIRTTVMLALFQCIHHTHESHEKVKVHILGCMALIKTAMPIRSAPANGIRGVLQLCYSLLIPCIQSAIFLPEKFFNWIRDSISSGYLPSDELPGASLINILGRFAQINATIHGTTHIDGHDDTAVVMQQLLDLNNSLDEWETKQEGKWRYDTHFDESLPPEAVFQTSYHRYSDVWTSRVWNHYRWARIITNQMLLEFVRSHPVTAASVISLGQENQSQETICRLAVEVLISVPTHYKHPKLSWQHLDIIQTHGGAGAGAVGIPHLMFHLQVAACAPGVPYSLWKWAVDVMDTAWGDLGMLHAQSLAEESRKHRAVLDKLVPEGILKVEPILDQHYPYYKSTEV